MIKTVVLPTACSKGSTVHSKKPRQSNPPVDRKVVGETRWKYAAEATDMMGLLRDLAAGVDVDRGSIRLIRSHLSGKLSSYRSQDVAKGLYREDMFIGFDELVSALIACGLACHFCGVGMQVLYASCRDPLQWSLDRIDNAAGHNTGNVYPVCLGCNLRRRVQTHDRFYFTKKVVWRKEGMDSEKEGMEKGPDSEEENAEKLCADKVL